MKLEDLYKQSFEISVKSNKSDVAEIIIRGNKMNLYADLASVVEGLKKSGLTEEMIRSAVEAGIEGHEKIGKKNKDKMKELKKFLELLED